VGPWSIGHRTEKSIFECWRDTISSAHHYVYIENQFFLSNLASTDVQNDLARVLLEKLVAAASQNIPFRAVIVIPLHPEGDFLNAAPVRHVMHYQYATICRYA
jgi:phospholipase D1/2